MLGIISCDPLRKVSTDGYHFEKEYVMYHSDTVAKLSNIEYSLDNNKLVKEATFKLVDMSYGEKGKSIIAFIHKKHKDWEVELDYPISFSPFIK
jgi:hypothetical protein